MDSQGLKKYPDDENTGCLFIVIIAILMLMAGYGLSGCTKYKYIENEKIVDHYNVRVDTIRDSISHDVFINQYIKGDTIFRDKVEYLYKDRYHTKCDTLIVRDTIRVKIPVETQATKQSWWDRLTANIASFFEGILAVVIIGFIVYVIFRVLKRFLIL